MRICVRQCANLMLLLLLYHVHEESLNWKKKGIVHVANSRA